MGQGPFEKRGWFGRISNTGNVLLSGDLYHYPEEITYKKIPSFDANKEQTAKSREMIEEFVKQNHAQLWIQHDYTAGIKRKIAPEFYADRILLEGTDVTALTAVFIARATAHDCGCQNSARNTYEVCSTERLARHPFC
jgi:hypothetical protein